MEALVTGYAGDAIVKATHTSTNLKSSPHVSAGVHFQTRSNPGSDIARGSPHNELYEPHKLDFK